ncbi:hypothetical protein [Actinoallomurus vinaceus]|uniref:hypothetical protein n=1 Tax=Actinoallomurus vinaceus TaxID=1080074 RepID=UPI0031EE67C7
MTAAAAPSPVRAAPGRPAVRDRVGGRTGRVGDARPYAVREVSQVTAPTTVRAVPERTRLGEARG